MEYHLLQYIKAKELNKAINLQMFKQKSSQMKDYQLKFIKPRELSKIIIIQILKQK